MTNETDWQSLALSQGLELSEAREKIDALEQELGEFKAMVDDLVICLNLNVNQVKDLKNRAPHNTVNVQEALRHGIKAIDEANRLRQTGSRKKT